VRHDTGKTAHRKGQNELAGLNDGAIDYAEPGRYRQRHILRFGQRGHKRAKGAMIVFQLPDINPTNPTPSHSTQATTAAIRPSK